MPPLDGDTQRMLPLRSKMGQIFHALRPSSLRTRRDSTWSLNPADLPPGEHSSPLSFPTPIPGQHHPVVHSSRLPPPPPLRLHSKRLPQVRSAESLRKSSSSDDRSLARVQSFDPATPPGGRVPLRHAATIQTVMPGEASSTTLIPSPLSPESPVDISSPAHASASPSAPVFRWLLPFLYRDGAHNGTIHPPDPLSATSTIQAPPPPPPPRRGEIICLKYDTLDDRGMRRLEGRSDHRPVIGTYAVYI